MSVTSPAFLGLSVTPCLAHNTGLSTTVTWYRRSDYRGEAGQLSTTSPLTAFSAGARSEPAFDWLVLARAWSRDSSLRSWLVLLSLRILGINRSANSISDAARILGPAFFIGDARAGSVASTRRRPKAAQPVLVGPVFTVTAPAWPAGATAAWPAGSVPGRLSLCKQPPKQGGRGGNRILAYAPGGKRA
jgi:hypothetical protein